MAVQLMLCIGAMAFVNLDVCKKGPVDIDVRKAKDVPDLRQRIEEYLQFELNDSDIIAEYMVKDADSGTVGKVFFAGNQENEKAVTFFYRDEMRRIPYSKIYHYLGCMVLPDEEDED